VNVPDPEPTQFVRTHTGLNEEYRVIPQWL
jgi:hypothetical protein